MATKRYDIGGFFNKLRDSQMDSTQAINMYESIDPITKKKTILPASGHEFVKDLVASNAFRAATVRNNLAYVVIGNEFIEIDSFFNETVLGTIGTSVGYVGLSQNEKQICIVDGTAGFIWDTGTSTFSTIVFGGPPFPPSGGSIVDFFPIDVTNIDGYFIFVGTEDRSGDIVPVWRISQLNNGKENATLDDVLFLSPGDVLVGCRALHLRLYIFGKSNTENWYPGTGLSGFPFVKDNSILFEHGLAAQGSLQQAFDVMFYISRDQDGVSGVQMITGTLPQKISTPAIDFALEGFSNIEDATSLLYKENGLIFYQINFTEDNRTFVFVYQDITPFQGGSWHELKTFDGNRHIGNTHFYLDNKHFIGSYLNQDLYELSYLIRTYASGPLESNKDLIKCILFGPLLENLGHKRIRLDRFEIVMVTGLLESPVIDPGQEPTISLSLSRDGGKTFGNIMEISVGNTSEFQKRVIFRRLGVLRGREIIPKIQFNFKIPLIITGIVLTYEDLSE